MNKEERRKYNKKYREEHKEELQRKDRIRKREKRAKQKAEEQKQDFERISREMKNGNLNVDMKPDNSFDSWTDYKKQNPEASKTDYIKEKINHKVPTIKLPREINDIVISFPVSASHPKQCENFRLRMLGVLPTNLSKTILIENHLHCDCCNEWRYRNKKSFFRWRGTNLWNFEEPKEETPIKDKFRGIFNGKNEHRVE